MRLRRTAPWISPYPMAENCRSGKYWVPWNELEVSVSAYWTFERMMYRVSIKSFPDYKHLLQENYVEYKHIFLPLLKVVSKILCHVFIVTLQLHNYKFEGKNNRRFCSNNWRHVWEHVERNWLSIACSPCNKRSTCWSVLMCCKKKNFLSYISKKRKQCLYFTYSSFLVINVCNQGNNLYSLCVTLYFMNVPLKLTPKSLNLRWK